MSFPDINQEQIDLSDVFHLFVDKELSQGASRTVYELAPGMFNRPMVLKIEHNPSHMRQNVAEFFLYQALSGTSAAKWLAPVLYISPNNRALLMERTTPLPRKEYPKKLPTFITDTKYENFGKLESGQFVCHDYGLCIDLAVSKGASAKRLRTIEWWSDDDA